MALYQVNAGDRILAVDNTQFYNILKGVAASGESITLIYNAAGSVILQPSSDPAAGTELIQIKNNAGTVQSALSSDGNIFAGNGGSTLPSLTFESDKDTGFYRVGANEIGLSLGGTIKIDFLSSLITIVPPVSLSSTLVVTGSSISVGTTPATAGAFNIPNATNIQARNSTNTNNVNIVQVAASDDAVVLGPGGEIVRAGGGKFVLTGTLTGGGLTTTYLQVATSGPLVYSGSGAPTISAAVKGSLYLRSDGVSNVTRMYVATDTAGTWTAVNTVA